MKLSQQRRSAYIKEGKNNYTKQVYTLGRGIL